MQKKMPAALKRIESAIHCKKPKEFDEGQLELADTKRKFDSFSIGVQAFLPLLIIQG
jgi:hypothetical protein